MNIKIRENARYAVACVTSMGLRITPADRMAVHNSNQFLLQATSAETNVLNVSSSLGKKCLAMTRFVEGSPMAAFIKAQLRARNIDFTGPEIPQGGPWGYRHQFNIADSGFGLRAPRVWNDRAGEVGRTISPEDFDLDRIFKEDGVSILHLSGLIAAMSPETTQTCLKLAEVAKENGTLVSFDLNYRATFWKGREEELREAFHRIASVADILIGNEEDFQLCLGFQGPKAGGKDLQSKERAPLGRPALGGRTVARRGAAPDPGDGQDRRRRRFFRRSALCGAAGLGAGEMAAVRLGQRRACGVQSQ